MSQFSRNLVRNLCHWRAPQLGNFKFHTISKSNMEDTTLWDGSHNSGI